MDGLLKKNMTDAERIALGEKLDKELDDFIDSLEKKRYTEGWPEDRWQEEMDKHPFFMKKSPELGDELDPLLEGIQQLKYDPNENHADDLANNYKEDGNFYIKNKKYRMAVMCFSEGLKCRSTNAEINAILYNNRSAAHFFLKNYRSSLLDAQKALELKGDYHKARWRGAQCAYHVNKFEECLKLCAEILDNHPTDVQALELEKKCKSKKIEFERDSRKKAAEQKRKTAQFKRTLEALKQRNVQFDELKPKTVITEEFLKPKFLPLEDYPVHCDENGKLIWPTAFSYPEFELSDFQQALHEDRTMKDIVNEMFSEGLEYDKDRKYKPESLNIYYENRKAAKVIKVDLKKSIKDIIQEKNFYVSGGSLLFYAVPAASKVEQEYLNQQRRPQTSD